MYINLWSPNVTTEVVLEEDTEEYSFNETNSLVVASPVAFRSRATVTGPVPLKAELIFFNNISLVLILPLNTKLLDTVKT